MRNLKQLFYLLLAVLLLLLLVWWERGALVATDQQRKGEAYFFADYKPNQVVAIKLRNAQGQIEFKRNPGDRWDILQPERSAAYDKEVEDLLIAVAVVRRQRVLEIAAGADLGRWGLESPLATLELKDASGRWRRLDFGGHDAWGQRYFVRVDNADQVVVVEYDISERLLEPLTFWRDRQCFSADIMANPESLKLTGASFQSELQLRDGQWWIDGKMADQRAVWAVVNSLANQEYDSFIEGLTEPDSAVTLAPVLTLTLGGADGATEWLKIGAPTLGMAPDSDCRVVAERLGVAGLRSVHQLSSLFVGRDYFVRKPIFDFDPEQVTEILVRSSRQLYVLTKNGEAWQWADARPALGVDAYLRQLPELLISRVKDRSGAAIVAPVGGQIAQEVEFVLAGGAGGRVPLTLYAPTKNEFLVRYRGELAACYLGDYDKLLITEARFEPKD